MTWVRIDDQFRHHPKVATAGPLGIALHVCGLSYAAEYLTDGFIPRGAVNTLCDFEGVWDKRFRPGSEDDFAWTVAEVRDLLVSVGMWDEVQGGYQIHDYLDYNPSKADVLAERDRKAAAGQAGGKASAKARAQRSAQAPAQADRQAESKPVPVPVPLKDGTSRSAIVENPEAVENPDSKLTKKERKGVYNFTNPGAISHNEILALYKKYIDPSFTWVNFSLDEQAKILKAGRSNNELVRLLLLSSLFLTVA